MGLLNRFRRFLHIKESEELMFELPPPYIAVQPPPDYHDDCIPPPYVGRGSRVFDRLPVKAFTRLLKLLPKEDAGCLALCDRTFYELMSPKYLNFPRYLDSREHFLERLSRDTPSLFFCYFCHVLEPSAPIIHAERGHAVQKLDRTILKRINPHESERLFRSNFYFRSKLRYQITLHDVQHALKHYLYGAGHGILPDSLDYREMAVKQSRFSELLSVDVQTCRGPRLLLRIQQWKVLENVKYHHIYGNTLRVCSHLDGSRAYRTLENALKAYRNPDASESDLPSDLAMCSICHTEFQFDIRDCGYDKPAVVLTRWMNVGSGSNPLDVRWANFCQYMPPGGSVREPAMTRTRFDLASGRARRTPIPSVEELTLENEECMRAIYSVRANFRWKKANWMQHGPSYLPTGVSPDIISWDT